MFAHIIYVSFSFYTDLTLSALPQAIEMVTLIPRFPLSANNCAIEVSNTRQSEFKIAEDTPSWIERGIASHVRRLLCPFSSSLEPSFSLKLLLYAMRKNITYALFDSFNVRFYFLINTFVHIYLKIVMYGVGQLES